LQVFPDDGAAVGDEGRIQQNNSLSPSSIVFTCKCSYYNYVLLVIINSIHKKRNCSPTGFDVLKAVTIECDAV
jgi:hypothetical protein